MHLAENCEAKGGVLEHKTEHRALTQLKKLAQAEKLVNDPAESWRVGELDDSSVKQAAVLILFGVLDEVPATHRQGHVADDLDVLIVVRAATLRQHAGQPAFPGGKVDPEDLATASETNKPVSYVAALREAVEETGLDPSGVEILGEFGEIGLPVSNFSVTPVLAWWNKPSLVAAQDAKESALVLRVPVADLLNPANRHMATVKHGKSVHSSPAFTVQNAEQEFVIWGFTGIVLDRIFTQLGWTEEWDSTVRRPAPGYEKK